jgi:hypothetical protein
MTFDKLLAMADCSECGPYQKHTNKIGWWTSLLVHTAKITRNYPNTLGTSLKLFRMKSRWNSPDPIGFDSVLFADRLIWKLANWEFTLWSFFILTSNQLIHHFFMWDHFC